MARNQGATETTKRDEPREGGSLQREQTGGASLAGRPLRGEILRSPFSLFERMFGDMDRIFEDFGLTSRLVPFERLGGVGLGGLSEWNPQVELFEREGKLIVRADLPGVKQEDLRVSLEEDSLVLSGERRSDRTEEGEGYWRSERSYGRFERVFPLPPNTDPGSIDAKFENGVLEVQIKLPEQLKSGREIPISAGASSSSAKPVEGGKESTKRQLS